MLSPELPAVPSGGVLVLSEADESEGAPADGEGLSFVPAVEPGVCAGDADGAS